MGEILDEIIEYKRAFVSEARKQVSIEEMAQTASSRLPGSSFARILTASEDVAVIAEVKKASPSRGVIRADFDPVVIAMHSCTPVFAGAARPWHVGILWRRDETSARRLIAALARDKSLCVGENQPYSALDTPGYTVAEVLEPRKLRHVIIEIRQDLIAESAGAEAWAERLADFFIREFGLVGPTS